MDLKPYPNSELGISVALSKALNLPGPDGNRAYDKFEVYTTLWSAEALTGHLYIVSRFNLRAQSELIHEEAAWMIRVNSKLLWSTLGTE